MTNSRAEKFGALMNLRNKSICMMKLYRKSTQLPNTYINCFESSFTELTQSSVIYSNAQLKLPNKKDQSFKNN